MARRKLQEVDASSIADIAFILLAFIIIATTLEKESGLPAILPRKSDVEATPPVNARNLLEILVNKNDEILIEGKWGSLEEIPDFVRKFMTNPNNSPDLPDIINVDETKCKTQLGILKAQYDAADYDGKGKIQKEINKWTAKLDAVKLVGPYSTVNKQATIAIQYDKSTSYGTYLGVRDKIMQGLNELRDEKSLDKFNISYAQLQAKRIEIKTDEDKEMIKAIRQVYPQRIIKLPAKNVAR